MARKLSSSYINSATFMNYLSQVATFVVSRSPRRLKSWILWILVKDVQADIARLILGRGSPLEFVHSMFRGLEMKALFDAGKEVFSSSFLLGTWESEVQAVINEGAPWDIFVDIGADVGLYPVAMLKHGLTREAWAYERLATSRKVIEDFSRQNGVEITLRGEFNQETVPELLEKLRTGGRSLILIDIEGAETELEENFLLELSQLDVTLVIELHRHFTKEGEIETLCARLADLFETRELLSWPSSAIRAYGDDFFRIPDWELLVGASDQRRAGQSWIVCRQRAEQAKLIEK